MKYALLALGAIVLIGALPATAEAGRKGCGRGGGGSSWSIGIGFGYASSGYGYGGYGSYGYGGYGGYGGGYCAPSYYAPAPVYVAPAPVYVAPPAVYCPPTYYNANCGYGGYYSGRASYRYCK
jgi:hypothetical protein